jgi:hypothetical protein
MNTYESNKFIKIRSLFGSMGVLKLEANNKKNDGNIKIIFFSIFWLLVIGFSIYQFFQPNSDDKLTDSQKHEKWYKEYQENNGKDPNIDQSRQYGGR